MIVPYTEWILKWRYLVIILSLVMVGIIGSGAPNLMPFSNDYRVFCMFSKAFNWGLSLLKNTR